MMLGLLCAVASASMGIEALRMLFSEFSGDREGEERGNGRKLTSGAIRTASLTSWWAYWTVLASCVLWCSLTL
jgi:hypothetical protein